MGPTNTQKLIGSKSMIKIPIDIGIQVRKPSRMLRAISTEKAITAITAKKRTTRIGTNIKRNSQ